MSISKNVLTFLLIVLAISLSGWSFYISKKSRHASLAENHEPDAYMTNIKATIINDEGKRTLLIESPRMTHYADNDTTDIDKPHVLVFRDSPEPWHIFSNTAKATQGIEEIFFSGDVLIQHSTDVAAPLTTMKTNTLTIFPKQEIAKTEDPILVEQPEITVEAVGMLANLKDGVVKLLSNARGQYGSMR